MRNFRKMIASISMVAILSSLVVSTAFAVSFTDVPADNGYSACVESLVVDGVLTPATTFNGNQNLKRGEAAKMAVLAAGYDTTAPAAVKKFMDVNLGDWEYKYVDASADHVVISGYANAAGVPTGYFGPKDNLQRAQYAKILVIALDLPILSPLPTVPSFTDVLASHWSYKYVETAHYYGLIDGFGDGSFKPGNPVTRFQAAKMTCVAMDPVIPEEDVTTPDEDEDTDTDSGDLEGGAGSIEDADFVAGLTGEEVGEGSEDVKVAGLDIDADDGSDLNLTALRLDFTPGTADQDFEDYATEVSVWFDNEELARLDASEFDDGNNYDKTVSFDEDAIIRADETGQLVVAVTGVSNLDTNDIGETWTVEFESVRFEDAAGAIITDNATGDINGVTRVFSFESFATSTDTELKIAEMSGAEADAINLAHMINVDATAGTDNVKLLAFTLKAVGDSDIEIREFISDIVVTGAGNVDGVIQGGTSPAARLIIDGEEYGVPAYNEDDDGLAVGVDEEIMWDDVNYTIPAGETVDAYIEVDLNDTTGAGGIDDLDEGDTILAQITAVQRAALTDIDARDETGTQIAVADETGTATGEANQVYNVMFTVESSGWTNTATQVGGFAGEDDEVTFNISYTVTAVDGDVYIDNSCTEDADGVLVIGDAPDGFDFFQTTGTLASIALTCAHTTTSGATLSTDRWLVTEGESETFNVSIRAIADVATSFVQVGWYGMGWSEADEAGDRLFEGSLSDEYLSNSVTLTQRV